MPTKSESNNPADLIKLAIAGLDAQIKEWTGKREQLAKIVSVAAPSAARRGRPTGVAAKTAKAAKPKRVVSEATKRKLRAAAKSRWAKIREEQGK